MSKINETVNKAVNQGIDDKIRKEKWAYDNAMRGGALERYTAGFERMREINASRVISLPTRKRDVIESTSFTHGVCVPRMLCTFGATRKYKIRADVFIGVKNVKSPVRAIRAAIEQNPTDIKTRGEGYVRSIERAKSGVLKCDNAASAALALDKAIMQHARHAAKGNAKDRATFRATLNRLSRWESVAEALEDIREGERTNAPKGPSTDNFVRKPAYYLERVAIEK